MLKKALILLCAIFMILPSPFCSAKGTAEFSAVETLYKLGFAKGTIASEYTTESFELDHFATRTEEATMVIRLLGKEEKAGFQKNPHPFDDVPLWASDNIGWLYENYVINGETPTHFGSEDTATVKQFSEMLLRILGYDDSAGDFDYDESVLFALNLGIVDNVIASRINLKRSDMFLMSYNTLKCNIKNSRRKLINKLCNEGVVDESIAKNEKLLSSDTISDAFPGVKENLGNIHVMTSYNSFKINFTKPIEEYGIRVFCTKI